jgi:3,4-dihydroxy 2-butanone 4-phosphate synthase
VSLEKALESLRLGKPIAVYDSDDREGEADLMFHAACASPEKIELLRKDAGGLICLATNEETAEKLKLPFFADFVCAEVSQIKEMKCTKTAYGDKPAFSISINHNKVYTGITDNDRALTISEFGKLVANGCDRSSFIKNFYTPGHVFLLISRGIEKRRGHTELSIELAKRAGLPPAMVLCEMLGKGKARSKEEVKEYCKKNGIVFLEGNDI